MKNKNEIARRVDEVMNSLDGIGKVQANPFLYAKIQHRMAGNTNQVSYVKWMYSAALILFALMLLNIYTYSSFIDSSVQVKSAGAGIDAFATEYNLNVNSDNL